MKPPVCSTSPTKPGGLLAPQKIQNISHLFLLDGTAHRHYTYI